METDDDQSMDWLLSQLPVLSITTASVLVERTLRRDSIRDRVCAQVLLWLATTLSLSGPSLAAVGVTTATAASESHADEAHTSHMISIRQQQRRIQAGWASLIFLSSLLSILIDARKHQTILARIRQRRRQQQQLQLQQQYGIRRVNLTQRIISISTDGAARCFRTAIPHVPIAAWVAHVTAVFGGKSTLAFAITWIALIVLRWYRRRRKRRTLHDSQQQVFRMTTTGGNPTFPTGRIATTTTSATSSGTPSPVAAAMPGIPTASSVSPSASSSVPMSSPQSASSTFFVPNDDDLANWYSWSSSRLLRWVYDVVTGPENAIVDDYGRAAVTDDDDDIFADDDDDDDGDADWLPFLSGGGGSSGNVPSRNTSLADDIISILAPQRLSGRVLDTLTASRLHQELGVPYGPACRIADAIDDLVTRYPKPNSMNVGGGTMNRRREPFTSSRLQVASSSSGAADDDEDYSRDNYLAQYDAQYNRGAVRRSIYSPTIKPAPPGNENILPEAHERMQQTMRGRYGLSLPQPKQVPMYRGGGAAAVSSSSTSDNSPNPVSSSTSSDPLTPPPPLPPYRPTIVGGGDADDAKKPPARPPPIEGADARNVLLELRRQRQQGLTTATTMEHPYPSSTTTPPVDLLDDTPQPLPNTTNDDPLSDIPPLVLQQMPPHIREIAMRNPNLVRQMLETSRLVTPPPRAAHHPPPMGSVAEHKEDMDSDDDDEDDEDASDDDDETTGLLTKSPPSVRYRSIG